MAHVFGRKLSKDFAADSVEKHWCGRDKLLEACERF